MARSTDDWSRPLPGREVAAVGLVVLAVALAHLVVPAVAPGYGLAARYGSYLLAFSVWMAWFVDWLAVRLGD